MKKIANVLIVVGVGIIVYAILYANIISSLQENTSALIMFIASLFIISAIIIKTLSNSIQYSKEKIYSRFIVSALFLIVVIINLIKSF